MKKIMVVTSTRADYGLLRPVVKRIYDSDKLELCLVATGTHLMEKYGNTVEEIEKDGYRDFHDRIIELLELTNNVTKQFFVKFFSDLNETENI